MRILRWILVPIACVLAWLQALLMGLFLLDAAESFCPEDRMVSGVCIATWWQPVERCILLFTAGLAAALVVAAGFFTSPANRNVAGWTVFYIGGLAAFSLCAETGAWAEFGSALAAGFLTALFLGRSRFAGAVVPLSGQSAVSKRVWGLSKPVWVLVFCLCVFTQIAGAFATNGRMNGWPDIVFYVVFAGLGMIALVNALRPVQRSGS